LEGEGSLIFRKRGDLLRVEGRLLFPEKGGRKERRSIAFVKNGSYPHLSDSTRGSSCKKGDRSTIDQGPHYDKLLLIEGVLHKLGST